MTKDQNHENDATPKTLKKKVVFKKKLVPAKQVLGFFKKEYVFENTHTNVCESSARSSPFLFQILISQKTKNNFSSRV